jgi:hypothetical protein
MCGGFNATNVHASAWQPYEHDANRNRMNKTETAANQHEYLKAGGTEQKEKGMDVATVPPPKISTVSHFSRAMVARANEAGILPHEILFLIAVDQNLVFNDCLAVKGKLIPIERHATLAERMQAARDVMPYYASKKPVEVAHSGQIQVLHALAESVLDATELDDAGNVIDADFEELE